jgi:ribosomal protein L24
MNTTGEYKGRKLYMGDAIKVKTGEHAGRQGLVCAIRNNRNITFFCKEIGRTLVIPEIDLRLVVSSEAK